MRLTDTRLGRQPERSPAGDQRERFTRCTRLCERFTLNWSGVCWPCQDQDQHEAQRDKEATHGPHT